MLYYGYMDGFSFETQQADEQVVLILRKHWATWFRWLIPVVLVLILPVVIEWFLTHGEISLLDGIGWKMRAPIWILIYTGGVFYVLERFLLWFYSTDVVTTRRVVDINFVFPFYRKVSESSLTQIQDISNVSDGLFRSLFDFGDVRVQTAGETSDAQITYSPKDESPKQSAAGLPDFIFEAVPRPDLVQKKILELVAKQREERLRAIATAI